MPRQKNDILRQVAMISAATFMLIAASIGSGAFGGTPVSALQDGALSAQGSYLAPAGPAFAIWSLIYLGLIAFTVWQALPGRRADERQRTAGGWIAASMVLNGLWLVTAQFGSLVMTVLVIAALLAVLARVIVLLGRAPARGWVERMLVDGVHGLHFGWVTIATVANTTAWLTRTVPDSWGRNAEVWAVSVLIVVLLITVASAWITRRVAPAVATAWGLAWVAVGRLADEPRSAVTAVAAMVVAVVLVAVAVGRRASTRAGESGRGAVRARAGSPSPTP